MRHKAYHGRLAPLILVMAVVGGLAGIARGQWAPPTDLSNDRERFAVDPHIAIDSAGYLHMAWQNFLDSIGGVWYCNNRSGFWSTPVKVANTGGKPSGPSIVITPDDVIHIFWGKSGHYEITRPASGGSWSSPQRLDQTYQGGWFLGSAVDSAGGIYAMWLRLFEDNPTPRNAIWGRYKPLGGSWGPEELVVEGLADNNFPGGGWLTAHGDTFFITYTLSKDAWYRTRPPGGPWSQAVFFDGRAGGVRFAWSPSGDEWAAAYAYDVDGDADQKWYEVFARFSHDGGNSWTPELNISNATALDRMCEVTYDANGDFHVVWQGFGCDGCQPNAIYRPRIDGTWQTKVNVSNTGARTGLAANAIVNQGNLLWLTYADNAIDGFEDIYLTSNPQNNWSNLGYIAGTVRDQNSNGIRYVTVDATGGYATLTGADGTYVLAVPPGTYSAVTADKDNFTDQTFTGITVSAGQTTPLDFSLVGGAVAPVIFLDVAWSANKTNLIHWQNSSSSNAAGTMIRYRTDGYPSGPTDGEFLLDSYGPPYAWRNHEHTGLTSGVTYYYAAYAHTDSMAFAPGVYAEGTPALDVDRDQDGDVDQADFGAFQRCMTGASAPQLDDDCVWARLDVDEDVDQDDFDLFQKCLSGEGVWADSGCAE